MDTALTERKALSIVVIGATRGPGLAVVKALVEAGHHVSGSTNTHADAAQLRALGALPVYVDELRGSELASVVRMAKADVMVDLGRQDLNQSLRPVQWDADELIARAKATVQAAKDGGAKFIVAASYAFVYGAADGHEVTEDTRPETSGHPLLKAIVKAEKAVLNGGVPACVLRLGYLYGPHMAQLKDISSAMRQGRPIATGEGVVNYVYVEDAAEAVRRACEAQPAGELFNVTDGHPMTSAEFLDVFAQETGMQTPSRLPKLLNMVLAGRSHNEQLSFSARVSSAKAAEKLGWKPGYSLHAGLADTLLWWRAGA
ncbi:MAG: NAD(P)-dependent oxidoreductase [Chloroflexi bacterium]|nr:NAD(P)-dependent oxidoreductase [Chloroflexota bacterium]